MLIFQYFNEQAFQYEVYQSSSTPIVDFYFFSRQLNDQYLSYHNSFLLKLNSKYLHLVNHLFIHQLNSKLQHQPNSIKQKFRILYHIKHLFMQSSQTLLYHPSNHLTPINHTSNPSNKKPHHYPNQHTNQSTQEYHTLKFFKKQNHQKPHNFNHTEKNFKQKHCVKKPPKNKINLIINKSKTHAKPNYTNKQNPIDHYPNLIIKRSGSTAPIRIRIKSQANKENHLNQEEKPTPQTKYKQKMQTVSSIFHYCNKSKPNKLSSVIKFRSKPSMIFCASKLPKDFFGCSLEDQHHGNEYRFLPVHLNSISQNYSLKKIKSNASTKLWNQIKQEQNIQKLNFDDKKPGPIQKNSKAEVEFTFRKQNKNKNPQLEENNTTTQTPNFQNIHHLISRTTEQKSTLNIKKNTVTEQEPPILFHRKYSRQYLKL